jgi:hypothetical protein
MPSSVIREMKYDPLSGTLRITFVSGTIYDYKEVPEPIFNEMKAAGSKGSFLNRKIKGRYAFEKIN